ncbi:MAG TPA: DNA-processing protein DprA [Rubricoccaceae bacterium]
MPDPLLFPDLPASGSAVSPEAGEVRALVALSLVPGVGSARIRALLTHLGSAERTMEAPVTRLAAVEGGGRQTAQAISTFRDGDAVDRQLAVAARVGARPLSFLDADYPDLLRQIYDPPALLWVRGRLDPADAHAVAVVGTRTATDYGRRVAEAFARGLAEAGVTVVSGLAYGIDAAAHTAALDAGGRTIAVLGSGVDRIYPARHAGLVRRILDTDAGAVISEMPMGAAPDAGNFPRRNRIVSGLSLGTLVAEARPTGGALLTAALALEQNREVFAAPAPVFSEMTGTNRLVQGGAAALVLDASEILDALAPRLPIREAARVPESPAPLPADLTAAERQLLGALGADPRPLDAVCDASGLDASTALVYLLQLEFRGLVRQLAGKQFFRP